MAIRIALVLGLFVLLMLAGAVNVVEVNLSQYAGIQINQTIINTTAENVNYSIKVKNVGEIELRNVEIEDRLPTGMKYVESMYINSDERFLRRILDINEIGETKSIIWNLGNIETNQEKEIVLFVSKMRKNTSPWNYCISAKGNALNIGVIDTNNCGEALFVDQLYDLENSKTRLNVTLFPGSKPTNVTDIDYLIIVKNAGDFRLNEIWLNDTLPENMVYVSSSSYDRNTLEVMSRLTPGDKDLIRNDNGTTKIVRLKLGDLDAGEEKHIRLTVRHRADEMMKNYYSDNVVEASGLVMDGLYKKYISHEAKETVDK